MMTFPYRQIIQNSNKEACDRLLPKVMGDN